MDLTLWFFRLVEIRFEVLVSLSLCFRFEFVSIGLVGMVWIRFGRVLVRFVCFPLIRNVFQGFRMGLFRFRVLRLLIGWFAILHICFHLMDGLVLVVAATWQSNEICAAL